MVAVDPSVVLVDALFYRADIATDYLESDENTRLDWSMGKALGHPRPCYVNTIRMGPKKYYRIFPKISRESIFFVKHLIEIRNPYTGMLLNSTDKLRGVIVGTMRTTNHYGTWGRKIRSHGIIPPNSYEGCDIEWNENAL
ncbi:hypothetical protein TNCV_1278541 [Trichonephila clavipes]|nr:hypothetical protein TNCV_1278541 [Trichonephila clavipes]